MHILVTGGAGYIGSHTCLELLNAGYRVTVVDNLCNSSRIALDRVEELTGKTLDFVELDLRDRAGLQQVFAQNPDIAAVIHFAGLKAVGESVEKPLLYYQNNLTATLNLCEVMREVGVWHLVFSSSATVYGTPEKLPILEDFPTSATNPYGRTKLMIEEILQDLALAEPRWQMVLLRYFNPVGAHESGRIGEDPKGIPNNLMPFITQVAAGKLAELAVFGSDYPTPDGTCIRDYLHVVDLARGHVAALERIPDDRAGVFIYNLGTGRGSSVLEMVHAFMDATGVKIPFRLAPRRAGDVAACFADASRAKEELAWQAQYGLFEMCRDAWNWQKNNPDGYPNATAGEPA